MQVLLSPLPSETRELFSGSAAGDAVVTRPSLDRRCKKYRMY